MKTKIVLEYLFPIPSSYEITYNSLPILAFNTILILEKEFKKNKIKNDKYIKYQQVDL